MYIVFLRFSNNERKSGALMAGHNAWITRGFDDCVFPVVGSLQPAPGGVVIAHAIGRTMLMQESPKILSWQTTS